MKKLGILITFAVALMPLFAPSAHAGWFPWGGWGGNGGHPGIGASEMAALGMFGASAAGAASYLLLRSRTRSRKK